MSHGDTLQLDISGADDGRFFEPVAVRTSGPAQRNFVTEKEFKLQQRDNMRRALEYAGWRISGKEGAAELLGLKPSTLTDRMRTYKLEKPVGEARKRAEP